MESILQLIDLEMDLLAQGNQLLKTLIDRNVAKRVASDVAYSMC